MVGAGIVGLSAALELAERDVDVTVIDRGPVDGGCAIASAGHLVPSHVVPLAAPGALRTAARDLVRRDGAVSVAWSAEPALWRWIARFTRSCSARSVAGAAPAMAALGRVSDAVWDGWLSPDDAVQTAGLFDVYRDRRAFDAARHHADALASWGVTVDVVDGATALAMEPALVGPVAGGVLLPDDRCLDPVRALDALIARVASAGVSLRPFHELIDLDTSGRRVVRLRTTAGDLAADEVVLAAGAWTGRVARLLGTRVPVIAARGLSLTVERPDVGPRRPMLLGEDHFAVGPTADTLRLSAWFQLNRYDLSVPADRIARLERMARGRLRLDPTLTVRRRWAGLRPVTPDGVPIIGRLPAWDNVTVATGHSMTGLTHGPGTGRLVAQLVSGEHPEIDLHRFAPGRFR